MKNYVFAGGTSGIGRAAALELARTGASILVLGRGRERGLATEQLLKAAGATEARWLQADLSSLAGIDEAAQRIRAWRDTLSGLTHSAMTVDLGHKRRVTADGFELAFGLQYLARAALNRALVDLLAASGDGRIVHVAAKPPRKLVLDLEDLQFERRRWSLLPALMSSQHLGFLHAQEATRRWPVAVSLACVGPTMTDTIREQPLWVRALYHLIATTPERSAQNVVRFLTDSTPHRGQVTLSASRFKPTLIAYDEALAKAVWSKTDALLRK